MKRIVTLLIIAILALSMIATPASAENLSGECGAGLTWSLDEATGVLTVSGSGEMDDFSEGSPWDGYKDKITEVMIEDGVKSISKMAFFDCKSLTAVTVPHSVETVEYTSFKGCDALETLNIDMEKIPLAFSQKESLKTVTIGEHTTLIGHSSFVLCPVLTTVTIDGPVTEIGSSAFERCTSLKSFTMPDTVKRMGDSVFYQCTSLTSVTLSRSLEEIFEGNFVECTALKTITIPSSVTKINMYAFYNCPELTTVAIPKSVKKIGDQAFGLCPSLKNVNYGGSKTDWGEVEVDPSNSALSDAKFTYNYKFEDAPGGRTPMDVTRLVAVIFVCTVTVAAVVVALLVWISGKKSGKKAGKKSKK